MNKSSIATRLLTHVAAGLLVGAGAYQFGLEKGRRQGAAVQEQRSKLGHSQNTAVYLVLAAKKEKEGDVALAESTRYRLLYGSVLDMQDAIDSGQLSPAELSKWPPGPVFSEVATYYRNHPESVTPIEDDPFAKDFVPKLRKLMDKYDPARTSSGGP
ncbi:hypothetical protein OKA04_05410 [Luteolibacter flavescens]|uniref:Uncharacterized protein n=1 Tax=Luteolibacter flavescens TaxID=1859460 RepID=A0ABT3FKR4_9BACT|nr:hypothetical protein [Luteolibacter flavescens]MCW1884158.1 hypothetical protein [Luteolibacter flavescens]